MKETITATDPRIMRLTAQADDITAMCQLEKPGLIDPWEQSAPAPRK